MSTSFPFLAIARAHGVPYGAVVRYADAMMAPQAPTYANWQFRLDMLAIALDDFGETVMHEIAEAVRWEHRRRLDHTSPAGVATLNSPRP